MLNKIDQLCVDTIRTLAMDTVQAAASGHPGTPMAMAPVAYTGQGMAAALRLPPIIHKRKRLQ